MYESRVTYVYSLKNGQYLFIRYSNDGGLSFTDNDGMDVGAWQGFYISNTAAPELIPNLFTWSKREGPYQLGN